MRVLFANCAAVLCAVASAASVSKVVNTTKTHRAPLIRSSSKVVSSSLNAQGKASYLQTTEAVLATCGTWSEKKYYCYVDSTKSYNKGEIASGQQSADRCSTSLAADNFKKCCASWCEGKGPGCCQANQHQGECKWVSGEKSLKKIPNGNVGSGSKWAVNCP
eukprot:TRINITY_DN2654_c0_g1_i1.p1 TRINITY_DN2654_c0_g1~~TRINITY_DN2654_c0_g1_i1.p1  ORF type:complete len:162 (-),score=16.96 TRINITY_DN2654_c0_g1_i1:193-678(-)